MKWNSSTRAQVLFFEAWTLAQERYLLTGCRTLARSALRHHSPAGTMVVTMRKKKPTLEQTARELTAMAEKFLSSLPVEEQNRRVENFEKAALRTSRAKRATSSKPRRTPSSRVASRAR